MHEKAKDLKYQTWLRRKKIFFEFHPSRWDILGEKLSKWQKIINSLISISFFKKWVKKMDFHPSRWVILGEKGMLWTKKHQNLQWILHFYLSAMIKVMKIRYLKKVVIQKSKNISLSEITCIITYQIVKPITITLRSNLSLLEKVVFRFMPLNEYLYISNHH